jgi:high-affinity nickel-transport protein
MLTLISLLAVGFALGMRHAMDADHVLAVATIVTRERNLRSAASIGMLWGIGHALTVLVVGALILLFELVISERLGMALEFAVGLMLAGLGIVSLWTAVRHRRAPRGLLPLPGAPGPHRQHLVNLGTRGIAAFSVGTGGATAVGGALPLRFRSLPACSEEPAHEHVHAHGDYMHLHAHSHGPGVHGHAEDATPQGRLDHWFGGLTFYQRLRPVLVGVVHGLAGSAAVALLVLAAVSDTLWGLAYLVIFGVGTTVGMMLVTLLLAAPLRFGAARSPRVGLGLRIGAGALSLGFGLFLMYQIGFVQGLFTAVRA